MIRRVLRLALILAVVAFLFVFAWLTWEYTSPRPGLTDRVFFDVEKGQGVSAIAAGLQKEGIIRSHLAFVLAYKLFYPGQSLKAGEYAFLPPVTAKAVLEAMVKGKVYLHPVTIPEGLTGREIAALLEAEGLTTLEDFYQAFTDTSPLDGWDPVATNCEGYLFPETYHFSRRSEAQELAGRMVAQFREAFAEAWRRRAQELGLSIRQVVILASLVEKETSRASEKKLVAAVFHNRLRIGMKLDCDPTIIYVLKQDNAYQGRLRTRDLKLASPYNTYLHRGLPPGPICNPGRASLEAALYPAEEDYLYFVSRNDGSHQFSRSFREHQLAVLKYQR